MKCNYENSSDLVDPLKVLQGVPRACVPRFETCWPRLMRKQPYDSFASPLAPLQAILLSKAIVSI